MPLSKTATTGNAFTAQFEYAGTIDTGPPLCIPAALEFRRDTCGGEENIRAYCVDLAERGERLIGDILGTSNFNIQGASRVNFANVRLPLTVGSVRIQRDGQSGDSNDIAVEHVPLVTTFLNEMFVEDFDTYIAICFWNGAWWARFSAQVYLDLSDFEYGGRVLQQLCDRVTKKEYLRMR